MEHPDEHHDMSLSSIREHPEAHHHMLSIGILPK
jgi:hypothetical protein